MKNKNIFGLMLAMVAGISSLMAQATLPAFWNCNDPASVPSGWTLNQGTTGTFVYTSASLVKSTPAAIRLDVTGEWMKVNYSGSADTVWYYISGTGASGVTVWKGTCNVEESTDGTTWKSVRQYVDGDMPMGITQHFTQVSSGAKFVRFILTTKVSGYNLAIDDVNVRPGKGGAKPELQVLYSGKIQLNKAEIRPGTTTPFAVVVKNNSTAGDLTVSNIQFSGTNAASFSTKQTTPFTVKAGEQLSIDVDVASGAPAGSLRSTMSFSSNDSNNLPFDLNIFGISGKYGTEPTASTTLTMVSNLAWKTTINAKGVAADGYLVMVSKNPITEVPVDGTIYQRGQIINGVRIMHMGAAGDIVLDNVWADTKYYIKAYSFGGYDAFVNYFSGASADLTYTSVGLSEGSYYGGLTSSDTSLVSKIRNVVRPHFQVYYSNFGSTMAMNFEARDTTEGKKIINCFYTGYPYVFTPPFFFDVNDPNYLSREHSYPFSWMGEASQDSANYSDLYLLYTVHQNKGNAVRSNYPMNNLKTVTTTFWGGKFGTDSTGGFAYEPRDFAKGSMARSNFYICATYNRPGVPFTIPTANTFLGMDQDQNVLKRWNKQFPPNGWEKARAEYVASIQKNRNPFIDHPDWACYIDFSKMKYVANGVSCGAGPVTSTSVKPAIVGVVAYPNPSNKTMTVDLAAFKGESAVVTLVDYFERTVFEQSNVNESLSLDVSRFAAGSYLLLVRSASKQAATAVIVK